ncbi:RNA polymerase factor sigma-32 [Telmatospirillum sp. J64-1]|uniref:RNA polymerase factor sigma-32 n=1 Tax=Telmatospirillum sp. J64-1 TaxID=2502183 RepID=UPI00115D8E84|nr:RNA polymerase factor sigma-32 [Telmatospirillum sp. J64-1]
MAEFSTYLAAVRSHSMLTPEEEDRLARAWRDQGDEEAGQRIVHAHLRLVLRMAVSFKGYGLPLSDIIAEGNLGLMQALKRYDPDRGLRFSTYALWWIRAAMFEYVLENSTPVKIGLTAERKKLFFKLRGLRAKLGDYSSGAMSDAEVDQVAETLGVRATIVREMEQLMDQPARSLDAPRSQEHEESWMASLASDEPDPEEILAEHQEKSWRRRLLAKAWEGLSQRERDILSGRRLREEPLRLEDLAQTHGISRERVRQIENAAVKKLKGLMESAAQALAPRSQKIA